MAKYHTMHFAYGQAAPIGVLTFHYGLIKRTQMEYELVGMLTVRCMATCSNSLKMERQMLKLGAIDTYFFVYISMQLHRKIIRTSDSAFVNVTDTNFFLQITASP